MENDPTITKLMITIVQIIIDTYLHHNNKEQLPIRKVRQNQAIITINENNENPHYCVNIYNKRQVFKETHTDTISINSSYLENTIFQNTKVIDHEMFTNSDSLSLSFSSTESSSYFTNTYIYSPTSSTTKIDRIKHQQQGKRKDRNLNNKISGQRRKK